MNENGQEEYTLDDMAETLIDAVELHELDGYFDSLDTIERDKVVPSDADGERIILTLMNGQRFLIRVDNNYQ